jgi:hypothetical protein
MRAHATAALDGGNGQTRPTLATVEPQTPPRAACADDASVATHLRCVADDACACARLAASAPHRPAPLTIPDYAPGPARDVSLYDVVLAARWHWLTKHALPELARLATTAGSVGLGQRERELVGIAALHSDESTDAAAPRNGGAL